MMVTKIATQGRPLHDDYVLEFAVSYGSNGFDYSDFKTSSGNVKVRFRFFFSTREPNAVNIEAVHIILVASLDISSTSSSFYV